MKKDVLNICLRALHRQALSEVALYRSMLFWNESELEITINRCKVVRRESKPSARARIPDGEQVEGFREGSPPAPACPRCRLRFRLPSA